MSLRPRAKSPMANALRRIGFPEMHAFDELIGGEQEIFG